MSLEEESFGPEEAEDTSSVDALGAFQRSCEALLTESDKAAGPDPGAAPGSKKPAIMLRYIGYLDRWVSIRAQPIDSLPRHRASLLVLTPESLDSSSQDPAHPPHPLRDLPRVIVS